MTADSGEPVQPVCIEMDCQHCGHSIETVIRVSPASVCGGSARVRCADCGRPSPYQEGGRPEPSPEWFVPLAESGSVIRFDAEVEP